MDPYANDWTRDGLRKLMGAIYSEAVRQAQAERARRREHAALERYLLWGVLPDGSVDAGIPPSFTVQTSEDAGRTWTPPSPLPAWRTRTPAEVAEYDRRFLHVLGIEWTPDLGAGEPRS